MSRSVEGIPRILFVMPWDLGPIGGVNAVVANLYEQFQAHGSLKPCVLVIDWGHKFPFLDQKTEYDKVRLRVRSPVEKINLACSLMKYLLTLPSELLKIRRIVKQLKVSVVNAHYPTLSMLTFALARRLGLIKTQLVLSFHGTDIRNAVSGKALIRWLWSLLLWQADAVVAVSQGLANEVIRFEPRVRKKTAVIYNGLNVSDFVGLAQTSTELSDLLAGRRVILEVGAFEHKKGQDLLLRAFFKLAKTYPELYLIMVGQCGVSSIEDEIEELARELGLAEKCTLLKNAPRQVVADCMRLAEIFVLPSRHEPFGIVLLEAGVFGLPVVASRVGGIPEIISGPEYGILVKSDDLDALERALDDMLQNVAMARKLGANLRQRVLEEFSWEQAYSKYDKMLIEITK